MERNGKAKIYIAAVLAALLVGATVFTLIYLRKGDQRQTSENLAAVPSGTVTLSTDIIPQAQVDETSQVQENDDYSSYPLNNTADCQAVINAYAADHGLNYYDYPIEIVNFLNSNPDALDFVLHYPENIGTQDSPDYPGTIDMTGDYTPVRVPDYYQYDVRWGYKTYAGGVMGITGSGPTALSMAASYLLGNSDMNPAWMASYAENNNYTMEGGTSWSLMSDGAIGLGIDVTPITADQDRIERNLDVGNLVMCLMGPGDFTNTAQFIIIVGYNDEGYEIRDPGSAQRTSVRWQFDTLAPQMNGCWIMRIL